jgi:hypothetical protein
MYTEIDDGTDDWTWQVAEADVLALAQETAALGDAVEEAFKNAASAFYDFYDGPAELAQGIASVPVADAALLAKIVAVLRQRALAGEHYRRIGELQQMAAAFAQMGRHCHDIAGVALELHGAAQTAVAQTAPDVNELLRMLIQQTYVVVRGIVVAVHSAHAPTARHVIAAAMELDRILLDLRNAAQRAIAFHSNCTLPLQHVVVAGGRMREIGIQAQAIARLVAQTTLAPGAGTAFRPFMD